MNKVTAELLGQACIKGNEMVDNFSFKILQLENKHKSKLINDVKAAKDDFIKELNEHLKIVDKFDIKTDVTSNLRRINKQGKSFKDSLDTKLEPVYKLKDHLKLNNFLRKNFESIPNGEEINELYELINRIDVKKLFDSDDTNDTEFEIALKEWSKKLIDNFRVKNSEKIENLKSVQIKSTTDFRNEIIQLKQEMEIQEFKNDAKVYQDEQDLRKLKETHRTYIDKELKEIIFELYQGNQTNQIQKFAKKLSLIEKSYLNELKKSDCNLIIQFLEHIQMFREKLWSKSNSILSELISNLNIDTEVTKLFSGDELLLKSLNECIDRTIKNYDTFIGKTIDHTLESTNQKLKEFDEQYFHELQTNENRINKELINKISKKINY